MNQCEIPGGQLICYFIYSLFTESSLSSQLQPDLQKEILEYVFRSREPMKSNPLEFWKNNENAFPLLSIAARRYLSPPATSVASEGMFSTARDVFSYRECEFVQERPK